MSATTASRARALARTFASRAASASQRPNVDVPGVYEIRTRIIQPSRLDDYIDVTTLRRYVNSNKPTAKPVHFKEKKKSEPANQKK